MLQNALQVHPQRAKIHQWGDSQVEFYRVHHLMMRALAARRLLELLLLSHKAR